MEERVETQELDLRLPRRPRARRRPWASAVILLALVTAAGGCGWYLWARQHPKPTRDDQAATWQPALQTVGAAVIGKGDVRIVMTELGTVTSLNTVTVLSQISGGLIEVGFKEGQEVKKGDFLAQIDPGPYQAALDQVLGTLAHDQALLEQAQTNLKRFQILGRQDSIAQQQVDDQRYLVARYVGTVRTDQANVDNARLKLAYCRILSPIHGQVGLRQIDPGNYVTAGGTTGIVTITQMQPISVLFSVPEDSLPDITWRTRSGAVLSVDAYDRANKRRLATGQLATVDNQIDPTTGTVKLRALFDNRDRSLYPNQFVNARLLVNTMHDAVRVPLQAVQQGAPGTYVYVIGRNNKIAVRPVDLGPTDGGFAAVLSGLQPGERVVTDGTDRLREGVAVAARVQAPALGPKEETGLAGQEQQHKEPSETHPVTPATQSDQQSAEASKALNRTQ